MYSCWLGIASILIWYQCTCICYCKIHLTETTFFRYRIHVYRFKGSSSLSLSVNITDDIIIEIIKIWILIHYRQFFHSFYQMLGSLPWYWCRQNKKITLILGPFSIQIKFISEGSFQLTIDQNCGYNGLNCFN